MNVPAIAESNEKAAPHEGTAITAPLAFLLEATREPVGAAAPVPSVTSEVAVPPTGEMSYNFAVRYKRRMLTQEIASTRGGNSILYVGVGSERGNILLEDVEGSLNTASADNTRWQIRALDIREDLHYGAQGIVD
jgi:hypothetical protein